MSGKKKLTVKKKKKVTLVPKSGETPKGEASLKWKESAPDQAAFDEASDAQLDPDDMEFMEGLSTVDEKHFRFYCYRCGQRLKVPLSWAKKMIACGQCDRNIIIPPPLEEDK